MKSQEENPKGLHARYYIQKITKVANPNFSATAKQSQVINNHDPYIDGLVPVEKDSEYFILRLDIGGSDIEHIKACRIGVQAYADAIEHHIPNLAKDLRKRYPLLTAPSTHSSSEMVEENSKRRINELLNEVRNLQVDNEKLKEELETPAYVYREKIIAVIADNHAIFKTPNERIELVRAIRRLI